jgi:hypothetical protein
VLVAIGAVLLFVVLVFKFILNDQHHNQLPRSFSRKKFIKPEQMPKHISAINDTYTKDKVLTFVLATVILVEELHKS